MKLDGGYGEIENEILHITLSDLSEEDREDYEKKLRKEDETAYFEFKEWQREYNQD